DVAKQTAIEFVRERRTDRIGLVAFAAQALTQVPITTDYAVLEQALRDLRIGMLEDGTAIGTGIATAANRLRRAPGKSRVIVLLTDGVNNRGTVDPRTAALGAASFGAAWARRARVRRAALWSQETVRAALAAGRLGPTALSISAFLGVVALAGPRWGEENIVAETRGLSLALAIDISRSMLAE